MVSQPAADPGRPARTSVPGGRLLAAPSARQQSTGAGSVPALSVTGVATPLRTLTPAQVDAIRAAMRLFVDDDLARGSAIRAKLYCDACERARPAPGFIQYDRYGLCNLCATEYEVARARGQVSTAGQYVRDKHFGDGALYELSD